jgi:L-rhamnose mutarotase
MKLVDEKIEDYCRAHTTPLPDVFARLRETTYRDALKTKKT